MRIEDCRMLPRESQSRLSRASRLAYRGRLDGAEIKIQEFHDEAHARFVAALTGELAGALPRVIDRAGAYLVTEWVAGEEPSSPERATPAIAALAAALHARPCAAGFDYPRFASERARRFAGPLAIGHVLDQLTARVEDCELPLRASHSDLTPRNMIVTPAGAIVSIDNELLGASRLPLFDVLNTGDRLHRNAGVAAMRRFLDEYRRHGSLDELRTHRAPYLALWNLRAIGSYLQKGKLARALAIIDRLDAPHPVLEAL